MMNDWNPFSRPAISKTDDSLARSIKNNTNSDPECVAILKMHYVLSWSLAFPEIMSSVEYHSSQANACSKELCIDNACVCRPIVSFPLRAHIYVTRKALPTPHISLPTNQLPTCFHPIQSTPLIHYAEWSKWKVGGMICHLTSYIVYGSSN